MIELFEFDVLTKVDYTSPTRSEKKSQRVFDDRIQDEIV